MLPNNQSEGNSQAPTGAAEQPTSPASGTETQPLPDYVTALQSQLAEVTTLVKGIQKGTDKQIGQVRGDIKRILELGGKGLDESAIQRELFLDQLISGQNTPAQQPTGSGTQPSAGLDVDGIVKRLQFEPNDPALAALQIKYKNNPQGFAEAAADLRLSQLTSPKPTPGTGLSQSNGNAASGMSDDQIEAKSSQLIELYKNYSQNKDAIEAIEKELESAGVLKRR